MSGLSDQVWHFLQQHNFILELECKFKVFFQMLIPSVSNLPGVLGRGRGKNKGHFSETKFLRNTVSEKDVSNFSGKLRPVVIAPTGEFLNFQMNEERHFQRNVGGVHSGIDCPPNKAKNYRWSVRVTGWAVLVQNRKAGLWGVQRHNTLCCQPGYVGPNAATFKSHNFLAPKWGNDTFKDRADSVRNEASPQIVGSW